MIENYLDTITNVTNYVDGILVVDSDYRSYIFHSTTRCSLPLKSRG